MHNLTSSELLTEQAIAKEGEPCSTELQLFGTQQTRARPADPVCCTKEITPVKERKWKGILACRSFKGKSLSSAISKLVMRLVRRYDQDERETDGAVHWNTMSPKLLKAFEDKGARKFSDMEWLQHIYEGSNKTRIEYCESSKKSLVFFRAIQGHTGGNMTAPEVDGSRRYSIQLEKVCVSHGGCSFNINSILETGLIAGGGESKEWKTNNLLYTSQPFSGDNPDEEAPSDDLSQLPARCTTTAIGNIPKMLFVGPDLFLCTRSRISILNKRNLTLHSRTHSCGGRLHSTR